MECEVLDFGEFTHAMSFVYLKDSFSKYEKLFGVFQIVFKIKKWKTHLNSPDPNPISISLFEILHLSSVKSDFKSEKQQINTSGGQV